MSAAERLYTEAMYPDAVNTSSALATVLPFTKTAKQREACDVLNSNKHVLLFGGSRSGKTVITVRNIFLRAMKKPSRHLILRLRFNHAKVSLWYDTIPKVIDGFFPELKDKIHYNKSDWFIEVPNKMGTMSQIWLGGLDDKDRAEKILGNEYSTIYLNECSQIIDYDSVVILRTRLAENSGLNLKFYYDCNPSSKRHWTYKEFVKKINPETGKPSKLRSAYFVLNPEDNRENLPEDYIEELDAMPDRKKKRFKDGVFLDDVEGALWNDQMVNMAQCLEIGDIVKTVVSVDPSTTNNKGSDECGIVVVSLDEYGNGYVEADYSKKCSPDQWATIVASAWEKHEANYVVAESNQGGDLVKSIIKSKNRSIKVKMVHASKGKKARAEPVSQLYEIDQQKVGHAKGLDKLEDELTQWLPDETTESPNRLDAVVWGLTELMVKPRIRVHA